MFSTYKYMSHSTWRERIPQSGSPRSCDKRSYDNSPHASVGATDSTYTSWVLPVAKSIVVKHSLLENAPDPPQAEKIIAILQDKDLT